MNEQMERIYEALSGMCPCLYNGEAVENLFARKRKVCVGEGH